MITTPKEGDGHNEFQGQSSVLENTVSVESELLKSLNGQESEYTEKIIEDHVGVAVKQRQQKYLKNELETKEDEFDRVEAKALELTDGQDSISKDSIDGRTDLNLEYHSHLYDFWTNYFLERDKERFTRHLTNGEKYRDLIKSVFRSYGLPEDLFYVGLIESGYNIHIRSHAAAVGPWQFIAGTATRYGMRVENQIDERQNIVKATEGAAKYFRDLYNIFGSWELALCAYNAGEYRIINAIRRGKTRSYKELVDKKLIPRETIYYVPKVAAARDISKARAKHQINVPMKKDDFYINTDVVEVKRNFTLEEVSKFTKIEMSILETLNPDFRWKEMTATSRRPIRLVVPKNISKRIAKNFDSGTQTPYTASTSRAPTGEITEYRVKRGDHLIGISRRFGVSVNDIKRLNNLRSNRILAGQTLKISSSKGTATSEYTVKRGDSLIGIARRFNINVQDIRAANNLQGSRILIGQKLRIPSGGQRLYVVRRGDNLTRIARQFNTTIQQIVRTNNLSSNTIHPGQKLRVPVDG